MASRRAATAKPTPAEGNQLDDELTELTPEASSPAKTLQSDQPEPERPKLLFDKQEGASSPFWRRLTPLAKQILLWGALAGVANAALSIVPDALIRGFAVSQQDLNNNAGLVNGWSCLSILLSLALPLAAGWRAIRYEGISRQGGLAGLWSAVVATVLGLIYSVILLVILKLSFTGSDVVGIVEDFLFQALVSFALGYLGASLSQRQRRRAQQQEATPS
jgi:hypothetical protein